MTRKSLAPGESRIPLADGSRRKFLKAATGAAAAGATLGFPTIVKAQGPIVMRWQSTWPSKDIFHEFALDFAKKVNDMTGGDLKIEVLPAGAVVPAFGLLDAVSKGTLDGGHGVLVYHYGKQNALALWGSGPAFGMDANMLLSWHKYGGGKELLTKLYASIGANVGFLPVRADADAAARLVQEADHQGRRLQGAQVPDGRHLHRPVHRDGRRGERAAGRRDRPGDGPRPARRGRVQQRLVGPPARFRRTCPRCACCRASTRTPSSSRSSFNKTKYDALPEKMQGDHRPTPSRQPRADMTWKAIDRYSQGLHRAADQGQRQVLQDAGRDPAEAARDLRRGDGQEESDNALFKEILESQKKFAARAVRWDLDTYVNRRMAYNHYFAKAAAPAKKA